MSERTEICQLVVTNAGEFGDVEYQFLFQAVDGTVRLGCNVRTYGSGTVTLKEVAPVTLTVDEARKFARLLGDMVVVVHEQKEKSE